MIFKIKRILALCLIFQLLISSCAIVSFAAEEKFVEGESGHFRSWAWLLPDEKAQHNVHQIFYISNGSTRPDDPENALANLSKMTPSEGAQKMKAFMEKKPEGGRVAMVLMSMMIMDPDGDGTNHGDNWMWWDAGVEKTIDLLKQLITEYKKINGPEIDGIIFDYEVDCSVWNLEWDKYRGKTLISDEEKEARYQGIIDDPRYQTTVRPMLEQLGFEFYEGDDHNELYYYWKHKGHDTNEGINPESFEIGLLYAQIHRMTEMNKFAEYIRSEYPNAAVSNYDDFFGIYNPNYPIVDYINASSISTDSKYWPIEKIIAGEGEFSRIYNETSMTHGAPVFYQYMYDDCEPREGVYPFDKYKKTPFNGLFKSVLDMQSVTMFGKAAGVGTQPWIMTYSNDYGLKYSSIICTDYYKEMVFHLCLMGADPILFFNAKANNEPWAEDDLVLSRCLEEMDTMAGFDDKEAIIPEEFAPADNRYALSGMNAGGRTIWRISPDLYCPDETQPNGTVTMESFLIDSEIPTFKIANQFVKFPEGSYIYRPENEQSEVGYWVVSPLGTKPEEWRDEALPEAKQTEYTYVLGQPEIELKTAFAETIPDIAEHWCAAEMKDFFAKGILKGENGLLVPDRQVTKAEFLAMLERGLGKSEKAYKGEIKDVTKTDWYAKVIQTAVDLGYIIPDENGNVYPDKPLSRQEMAEITCRALPELESGDITIDFKDDAAIDVDAKEAVNKLVSLGILEGYPDGEFKPKNVSTRAETVVVLTGLFSKYE